MTTEKCPSVCLLDYDKIFSSPKNRPCALLGLSLKQHSWGLNVIRSRNYWGKGKLRKAVSFQAIAWNRLWCFLWLNIFPNEWQKIDCTEWKIRMAFCNLSLYFVTIGTGLKMYLSLQIMTAAINCRNILVVY